jgi:hypothetical protein
VYRESKGRGGKRVALAAGKRFPSVQGRNVVFHLERTVTAKFTTVTSAAVIDDISTEFAAALKRLATK